MLASSAIIAAQLPAGFFANLAMDILLALYVAEEDARYLSIDDLDPAGATSPTLVRRWVRALEAEGLIERRDDLVALTVDGHAATSNILRTVYDAQRSLD